MFEVIMFALAYVAVAIMSYGPRGLIEAIDNPNRRARTDTRRAWLTIAALWPAALIIALAARVPSLLAAVNGWLRTEV